MNTRRTGLVLLAGLAFGSSIVVSRFGLRELSPLTLVMLRLLVGTIVFAVLLLVLRRNLPRDRRTWQDMALVGATTIGIPLSGFTFSLQYISSGVLTIFIALIPMLTGIIAHLLLAHEKLTRQLITGLAVGLSGVVLVMLTGTTGLAVEGDADFRGHFLALGAALLSAAGTVYARSRLRHADAVVATGVQMLASFLIVAPVVMILSPVDLSAVTGQSWLVVIYIGVIGSCLGFLLIFYMIQTYGATFATLPGYVVPVVSTLLGALFLGEVVTAPLVIGAALALLGVFLATR